MLELFTGEFEDLAVEVFAVHGHESKRAPMAGSPGWEEVLSGFFKLDGVVGYMTASYCESNGFKGNDFHPLHKIPAHEIKRGRMPAWHVAIEGARYSAGGYQAW